MTIRPYQETDEEAVIGLWRRCGLIVPQNNPRADIRRKLADSPALFFVGTVGSTLMATAMAGYDGHRGAVNYLAVEPRLQRSGYGRKLMAHIEQLLHAQGCPKINLQVRTSNQEVIAFYERLGFARDQVVCLGKRLQVDEPSVPENT